MAFSVRGKDRRHLREQRGRQDQPAGCPVLSVFHQKLFFPLRPAKRVHRGAAGFRLEGHFEKEEKRRRSYASCGRRVRKSSWRMGRRMRNFPGISAGSPVSSSPPTTSRSSRAASEERRRFLDAFLSQLDPVYLQNLIDYNKILQQRNGFLKSLTERRLTDRGACWKCMTVNCPGGRG
jgi:DNA replication and repair protein RecF